MKKILTVLLALSVVFTYSFATVGTAFAATPLTEAEYDQLVEQAAAQVEATTNTAYTEAVKVLPDHDVDSITGIGAEYWKANASVYGNKLSDMIDKKEAEIKQLFNSHQTDVENATLDTLVKYFATAKGSDYVSGATAEAAAIPTSVTDITTAIQNDTDVQLAVAKAYGNSQADDAIIALKGIDVTVYSNTVNTETNMSSVAMATAVINEAIAEIEKLDFDAKESVSDVKNVLDSLGKFKSGTLDAVTGEVTEGTVGSGILKDFVHATDSTYGIEKYVIAADTKYDGQSLVTKDKETADANKLAATKASYLAKVASEYASYLAAATTADQKAEAEAYKAGVSEIINAAETMSDLNAIFADENAISAQKPGSSSKYAQDKEAIDDLVVFANKYIAEGYDAEKINKIVAGAKVEAYKLAAVWDGTWNGTDNAKDAIKAAVLEQFDTKLVDAEVAKAEQALESKLEETGNSGYYAPEAEKVTTLYNTIITELKACISEKEISEVKAKYNCSSDYNNPKGLSDIATKSAVKAAIQKTKTGDTGWTNNVAAIKAYADALNAGVAEANQRDFVGAGMFTNATTVNEDWLADFYAEKGARTTAEAFAMIPQAKAELESVMTKAAVKIAVQAVEAQIAALPEATKITASDAAAVEAAQKAYDDLKEQTGADISATAKITLGNAVTAAYNASKLELLKAVNAYSGKEVTSADKANLESLLEQINTFNEKTKSGKVYAGKSAITAEKTAVQNYLKEIRNKAKADVLKAIAALPLTVTEDNMSVVDNAEKLYNDYVDTYTDFYTAVDDIYGSGSGFNQNAAKDISNAVTKELKDAVEAADKIKAENDAAEKEEIIASVESLKIVKNHSTAGRTNGKSWIRIEWSTQGDDSYVQGYEIYKSTKKNSGYKYSFTTKNPENKWYKNTAGLKKGTRYYYKVRAIVEVDGQKYTSDWSNKAYRIAK